MKTWNDYKKYVKTSDSTAGKDITDMEEQAEIVTAIIKRRNELGMSQRDLSALCGIPQSSVARIESFKTSPNLSTLVKILRPLGLKINISK